MNNSPLVSVITPAFNAAKTVAQTIDSVISQTYSNWELILVDDASTDGTGFIFDYYERSDSRIRVLRNEKNTGTPGKAKNIALLKARGEYLAFLDADDFWLKEKLEIQVEKIIESGADLCYCGGWYVDEFSKECGKFSPQYTEGWLFDCLLKQYEINSQTVIMKRSALLKLEKPYFNPNIVIGEDYELFMRIASTGKLLPINNKLVSYRLRKNSISITKINHSHEGLAEVIRWVCADRVLAVRCEKSLRHTHAKLGFYRAKAAMTRGEKKIAFAALRPSMLINWRYSVLALATYVPFMWGFCMRFSVR
jgi:teichuronic acid biosynthesis glycosyltransferase TuaG